MKALSEQDIQTVLDERVRPLLRAHNGDVELTAIEEGRVVRLRLLGAEQPPLRVGVDLLDRSAHTRLAPR